MSPGHQGVEPAGSQPSRPRRTKKATVKVALLFGGGGRNVSVSPWGDPAILHRVRLRIADVPGTHRRPTRCPPDIELSNQRVLIPTNLAKQKSHRRGGVFVWWRRRECVCLALGRSSHPSPRAALDRRCAWSASASNPMSPGHQVVEPRRFSPARPTNKKTTIAGGLLFDWWRRAESNRRPQALYRQFYILSQAI